MDQRKEKIGYRRSLAVAKLCIAGGALWFIWYKVFHRESTVDVLLQFRQLYRDDDRRTFFLAALLLMPLNWGMEAWKWKLMITRLQPLGFLRAFEGVLSGLTVSFFTPNRVGEYAGRVLYLADGNRIKGTLLTVIESVAQLVITLVMGALALPIFLQRYASLPGYLSGPVILVSVLFSVLATALFLKMSSLGRSLPRIGFLQRFERYLQVATLATPSLLSRILGLSLLRFWIFSFQLYFLLLAFGVEVPPEQALLMTVMTFFVLTLVPTFAFADLGVRGAAGTFFFAFVTAHLSGVVYATVALWLINLAFPAALGALLMALSPKRKEKA